MYLPDDRCAADCPAQDQSGVTFAQHNTPHQVLGSLPAYSRQSILRRSEYSVET